MTRNEFNSKLNNLINQNKTGHSIKANDFFVCYVKQEDGTPQFEISKYDERIEDYNLIHVEESIDKIYDYVSSNA